MKKLFISLLVAVATIFATQAQTTTKSFDTSVLEFNTLTLNETDLNNGVYTTFENGAKLSLHIENNLCTLILRIGLKNIIVRNIDNVSIHYDDNNNFALINNDTNNIVLVYSNEKKSLAFKDFENL